MFATPLSRTIWTKSGCLTQATNHVTAFYSGSYFRGGVWGWQIGHILFVGVLQLVLGRWSCEVTTEHQGRQLCWAMYETSKAEEAAWEGTDPQGEGSKDGEAMCFGGVRGWPRFLRVFRLLGLLGLLPWVPERPLQAIAALPPPIS